MSHIIPKFLLEKTHQFSKTTGETLALDSEGHLCLKEDKNLNAISLSKISEILNSFSKWDFIDFTIDEFPFWKKNIEQINLKIQSHNDAVNAFKDSVYRRYGDIASVIYFVFNAIHSLFGYDDYTIIEKVKDIMPHGNSHIPINNNDETFITPFGIDLKDGTEVGDIDAKACLAFIAENIIPYDANQLHYYKLIVQALMESKASVREIRYGFNFIDKKLEVDHSFNQTKADFVIILKTKNIFEKNPKILVNSQIRKDMEDINRIKSTIVDACVKYICGVLIDLDVYESR